MQAFNRRRALMLGAAFSLAGSAVMAAPKAKLIDDRWRTSGSGGDPDYGVWAEFLKAYLRPGADGVIRVAYGQAQADGADRALRVWLGQTQQTDPGALSPAAQRAWWYNLYNAATVDLVLADYPVGSIKKIKGGLFNTGPWEEDVLTVNGVALCLNDIEHGILRPIFNDNRVHYAVNCASIGCPNLKATPWVSATLETDLDAAAREYANHPRGASVSGDKLTVSKIYTWYDVDFGGSEAGVIKHLKQYAGPDLATALGGVSGVDDDTYDWDLNGA